MPNPRIVDPDVRRVRREQGTNRNVGGLWFPLLAEQTDPPKFVVLPQAAMNEYCVGRDTRLAKYLFELSKQVHGMDLGICKNNALPVAVSLHEVDDS